MLNIHGHNAVNNEFTYLSLQYHSSGNSSTTSAHRYLVEAFAIYHKHGNQPRYPLLGQPLLALSDPSNPNNLETFSSALHQQLLVDGMGRVATAILFITLFLDHSLGFGMHFLITLFKIPGQKVSAIHIRHKDQR